MVMGQRNINTIWHILSLRPLYIETGKKLMKMMLVSEVIT